MTLAVPPSFAVVGFRNQRGRPHRIWIPVFLLWPFLLIAGAIVTVALVVARRAVRAGGRDSRTFIPGPEAVWLTYLASCALRGLLIDVREKENDFVIRLI